MVLSYTRFFEPQRGKPDISEHTVTALVLVTGEFHPNPNVYILFLIASNSFGLDRLNNIFLEDSKAQGEDVRVSKWTDSIKPLECLNPHTTCPYSTDRNVMLVIVIHSDFSHERKEREKYEQLWNFSILDVKVLLGTLFNNETAAS